MKSKLSGKVEVCTIYGTPNTGASCNVILLKYAKQLGLKIRHAGQIKLRNASNEFMKINGIATFWAKICKDQYTLVEAVVSSDMSDKFLISHLTQKSLGILPEGWPFSYNAEMNNGLQEVNMSNVNLLEDRKDVVWPNPKLPKEFRDLCVEYENILVDTLTPVSRLHVPPNGGACEEGGEDSKQYTKSKVNTIAFEGFGR